MRGAIVQLSVRLSAIASFVPKGSHVIDVGTDHAYIPIYLVESGLAVTCLATDINKGPLEKAQKRMNSCLATAMESLKKNDEVSILSWEQDPMETTILFYNSKDEFCKHFVVIDERIIDEDADEFLFAESN